MNDRRTVRAAAAALTTLLSLLLYVPRAHALTPQPVAIVDQDLSHAPTVAITVSGAPLAGADLPGTAFQVRERDRAVPFTVRREPTTDLEVVLLLDTSGSMAGAPIAAAKEAATEFIRTLPSGARVSVIGFGPTPTVAFPFTTDGNSAAAAVDHLRAGGETALYDGLVTAAGAFSNGPGHRRAVVLLSDGGDTVSHAHLSEAVGALQAKAASVSAVELLTKESDTTSLEQVASATRGTVIPVNEPAALRAAYASVAGNLVGRFRLTYTSSSHGPTPVSVRITTRTGVYDAATTLGLPRLVSPHATPIVQRALGNRALLVGGAGLFFVALLLLLGVVLVPSAIRIRLANTRPSTTSLTGMAQRASAAAERTLERRGQRRTLEVALDQAGLAMRPGEAIVLAIGLTIALGVVGLLFGGLVLAVLLAVVALLGCRLGLSFLRDRRRQHFADQLDGLLQMVAGSLRTGYGLLQALDTAARETEAPAADELRRLTTEVRLGRDLGDALETMANRVASEDFEWVAQAIRIHREIGGDLAEVLDRVSETIRARNHLARQVKSLTAEGRMSAYVLLALPVGLTALIRITNPSYLGLLTSSGVGIAMVCAGVGLLAVGALWLRHLIRPIY